MENQPNTDPQGVQIEKREVVRHTSQPENRPEAQTPSQQFRRKVYDRLSESAGKSPSYESYDKYLSTEKGSKYIYDRLLDLNDGEGPSLEKFRQAIGYQGSTSQEQPQTQNTPQNQNDPQAQTQSDEEFVKITPDKYPTRGNKSFKNPVSKKILDQSLPVLQSKDLVITDGRDSSIHKSSKQNSGHSIDVALKNRDYTDDKIVDVIKEGRSNNLNFEFESKDREQIDRLKKQYPEYADNIKYVSHITAPHFSVYHGEGGAAQANRPMDVAGSMGPPEPRNLEKRNALIEAKRLKKEVYDETFNELKKTANPQAGGANAALKRVRTEATKKSREAAQEYLKSSGIDVTELSTDEVGDIFQNLSEVEGAADRIQSDADADLENDYFGEGLMAYRDNPKSKDGKFRMNDFQKTAKSLNPSTSIWHDATYMSPEEIMSAEILEDGKVQYKDSKTGELKRVEINSGFNDSGFDGEDLLAAKDHVAMSSTIKRSVRASALSQRQDLLATGFEGMMGEMSDEDRDKFDEAMQVANMSPTEEEVAEMSTDERANINNAVKTLQDLSQKYPDVISNISKYQESFNEVLQEFEELDRTEQNAVIVEKLNQKLTDAASKRYAENSSVWNRLITAKRLASEAPSRFINETGSTANAALAMFGHQGAQDALVAGFYSTSDDYDIRSYQEKAKGIRKVTMFDKYMVVRDDDGNVEEVLDRSTEIPTKNEDVRGPDGRIKPEWLEGFHAHPSSNIIERDYNAASIFNQLQQTGSEMAGIVALGMITGGAASAGKSVVGRLVKRKAKKEATKAAVKASAKKGLSKKAIGDRLAEVVGSIGMFSGRSAQDAIGAGFDFDEAGLIGLTKGAAEGTIAAIMPTLGRVGGNLRRGMVGKRTSDILKAAGKVGTKLDKKALDNLLTVINKGKPKLAIKEAVQSLGKDVGGEILEENAMNYLEPAINRGYNNLASGYFDDEELFDVSWDQILETSLVSAGAAFLPGSINAISQSREGLNSEYLSSTMKAVMKHPTLFGEYLQDAKDSGVISEQEFQDTQTLLSSVEQDRESLLEMEEVSEDMAGEYAYHSFMERALTSAAQASESEGTGNQERLANMADVARDNKEIVKMEFAQEQARRKGKPSSGPAVNVKPKDNTSQQTKEEATKESESKKPAELSENQAQSIATKIQNDPESLSDEEYQAYKQNRSQVEKYLDMDNVAFESKAADPEKEQRDAIIRGEDPSQVDEVVYDSVDGSSRVVSKKGYEMVQIKDNDGNWKYHPYQSSPRAQNVRNELAGRPTREQSRQEFNESRSPKRATETVLTQASTVGEAMTTSVTPGAQGQAVVTDRATQKRGTIGMNHQRGTFEFRYQDDNGKTKVKELGKVSELKDRSLDDLGFATDNQVKPLGDGRFEINGKEYINEVGQGAVSETRSGKRKVTLTGASTGKKRRFYTPKVVEDLAYQIYLEESAQEEQAFENFFQRKIEEYERNVRSNQKRGASQEGTGATQGATDTNAEGVSEPGQDTGRDSGGTTGTTGASGTTGGTQSGTDSATNASPKRDVNAIYELFFGERKDDSDTYSPATGSLRVSDSADNALQRKVLKQLEKALTFISGQMPDLKIQIHKSRESYELAILKLEGGTLENAKETAGAYDMASGTIHINMKSPRLKKNTLFHEVLHPVFTAMKDQNPDLYIEMVETVREALDTNETVANKLKDFMEQYSDQGNAVMEEEMLVEFVSQIATGEINTTQNEKRGFLQSVRSFLKSSFGYNNAEAVSMTDGPIEGQLRMLAQALNEGIKLEFDQSQATFADFDPTMNYGDQTNELAEPRRTYDDPLEAMNDASIDTGSFSSSVRTFTTDAGKFAVGKVGEMLIPFFSNGEKFIPFVGYDSDGKMIPFADPETGELLINSPKLEHASRIINAGFSPQMTAASDSDTNIEDFQSALSEMVPEFQGDPMEMSTSELSSSLQEHFEKYKQEPQVRFQKTGSPNSTVDVKIGKGFQNTELLNKYLSDLASVKEASPETYWSVDDVTREVALRSTIIDNGEGYAVVSRDGDIKGVFKKLGSKAKGVADSLLEAAVTLGGGTKLDNFDNYLTKVYTRSGFRVAGRMPFSVEYAPKGWVESKHGKPDVVAMVYDPNSEMDIEEKVFDNYNEMLAYRNSYLSQNAEGSKIRYQKTPNLNTEGTLVKTYISSRGEDTIASSRKMSAVYNAGGQATRIDIPKDKILDLSEYNDMYRSATGSDILSGALFRIDSESIENSYEFELETFAEAVGQEQANNLRELMTNAEHISAPDALSPSDTDYWIKAMSNIEEGPTAPGLNTRRVDARRTPMDYMFDDLDVRTDEGGDFIFGEQFKLYISDFNAPLTVIEKPNWVRVDNAQIQDDFSIDEEVLDAIRGMKLAMNSAGGSIIFSDSAMNNMAGSPESEALLEVILEDEGFVKTDYGYLRGPGNKIPTERFRYEDLEFVRQPNGAYMTLQGQPIDSDGSIQGTIEFERWSEGFPVVESNNIQRQAKTGQSSVYKVFHATMADFYEFDARLNSELGAYGFLGNTNYFTSSEYDASVNYGNDSSVDNEAKISTMLDRFTPALVQSVGSAMITSPDQYASFSTELEAFFRDSLDTNKPTDTTLRELGFTPYNTFSIADALKAYIKDTFFDSQNAKVLQLFVKSSNPIVLDGNKISHQNYDSDVFTDDQLDSAWAEVKEQYGLESDSQRGDYMTEVYQRAFDKHDIDSQVLMALNDAIEIEGFDTNAAELLGDSELYNSSMVDLNEVYENLKEKVSGGLISTFLTNLGFDSIVLRDAVSEFNLDSNESNGPTSHVHIPHIHRNNIKLADGRNATFGESADIRFQKVGKKNQEVPNAKASRKVDVLDRISRAANSRVLDKYSVDDVYNNLGKVSDELKSLGVTKEELRESLNRRSYFEAPKSLRDKAKRDREIEKDVKARLAARAGNLKSTMNSAKYKRMLRLVKKAEKVFKPFLGNIEFHIAKTPEDFVDKVVRLGGTASMTDRGAYVENAGIVLNFSEAGDVDILHEGLHPVLNTVFQLRPDLLQNFYNQLVELADSDPRVKSVIEFGERYAEKNEDGETTNTEEVMDESVVQFFAEFMSGEIDVDIPNMSSTDKNSFLQKIRDIINDIIGKFFTDWVVRKKKNTTDMRLFAETLRSAYTSNRRVRTLDLIGEKVDPKVLATRDKNFHKKSCP